MRPLYIFSGGVVVCGTIVGIRLLTGEATADVSPAKATAPCLKVGDAVPDAELADQDGRTFRLSDLRGKPVVIAFIYTSCNMPTMCPLATSKLVKARERTRALGVAGAEFVVVSFDPGHDRPARLKAFAARYSADQAGFRLATGAPDDIRRLSQALATFYREGAPGVFEHNIVVSILDARGVLRDQFFGTTFEPDEVARAVKTVAGE